MCCNRATTHSDLALRAKQQGIKVQVIHNASIMNAVACCGLQLYHLIEILDRFILLSDTHLGKQYLLYFGLKIGNQIVFMTKSKSIELLDSIHYVC